MSESEALDILANRRSTREELEAAAAAMEDRNRHELARALRAEARNR
jgi:cation transport ATPase